MRKVLKHIKTNSHFGIKDANIIALEAIVDGKVIESNADIDTLNTFTAETIADNKTNGIIVEYKVEI
jgi:hypothetical protein